MSKPTPGPYLRDNRLIYTLDESGKANRMSLMIQGGHVLWDQHTRVLTPEEELIETAKFVEKAMNHHQNLMATLELAMKTLNAAPRFKVKGVSYDSYAVAAKCMQTIQEVKAS